MKIFGNVRSEIEELRKSNNRG